MMASNSAEPTMTRITRIAAYQVDVPLKTAYTMSGGRSYTAFDTTILEVETNTGVVGWGEVAPLGSTYLPAYAEGARTGMREIAPYLLGSDPTQTLRISHIMDSSMRGHPYVKSAFDIACWDILGKITNLPVCTLLGGQFGEDLKLYKAVSQGTPDEMAELVQQYRKEGYSHFQLKVGGCSDINVDIARIRSAMAALHEGEQLVADANGGWLPVEAARVIKAVDDLDLFIEQPCSSYEECLSVRHRARGPIILDEVIDSLSMLQRAIADDAMDGINLKLSRVGGLTHARTMRDVCISNGMSMVVEDAGGTDVISSAIFHLALSIPERMRFAVVLPNSKTIVSTARGAPKVCRGRAMGALSAGLGVEPVYELLGTPIFEVS
jgi:cis-L-3-hydroxyproline dehydratase